MNSRNAYFLLIRVLLLLSVFCLLLASFSYLMGLPWRGLMGVSSFALAWSVWQYDKCVLVQAREAINRVNKKFHVKL